MSHFSNVRTTITNLEILDAAVKQLGYTLERGSDVYARGYSGQRIKVDARIVGKHGYDIGFKKNQDSDSYDLVVDWWGAAHEFGQSDVFTGRLTDAYTEQGAMSAARQNRWNLVDRREVQEGADEYIVLKFRQTGDTSSWQGRWGS